MAINKALINHINDLLPKDYRIISDSPTHTLVGPYYIRSLYESDLMDYEGIQPLMQICDSHKVADIITTIETTAPIGAVSIPAALQRLRHEKFAEK